MNRLFKAKSRARKLIRQLRSREEPRPTEFGAALSLEPLEARWMLDLNVPLLSSLPGAPVTVHLDFDGTPAFLFDSVKDQWASGPLEGDDDPIPAFSLDSDVLNFSAGEISAISQIWQHVSEKFSPFNINVTTVVPPGYFNGVAVHAILGGSKNDWLNEDGSGVAKLGSFWDEKPNSAFVFTADKVAVLNGDASTINKATRNSIAETAAHEVGHTFGLRHQSSVDGSNNVLDEYYDGDTNTAPIMGGSSGQSDKRGLWWNGPSSQRDADENLTYTGMQNDLAILTAGTVITYRTDDYGPFSGAGTITVNPADGSAYAQGVIETNGDVDAFVFNAIGPIVSFEVKNATYGGMLTPTVELIPLGQSAAGNVTVTTTDTSAKLDATNLTPGGGYLLRVSRRDSQYGNIGQYSITGTTGAFAGLASGILTVNGYGTNNELSISYITSSDMIVLQDDVFGGAAVMQFLRSEVTSIDVKFATGFFDDTTRVLGQYSALNIPVYIHGNGDRIHLEGTSGIDNFSISDFSLIANNTTIYFVAGSYFSEVQVNGFDDADVFSVASTVTDLRLLGDAGNDTFTVGTAFATFDDIEAPVFVYGDLGSDTLNIGNGNADGIAGNITFDGGTGGGAFTDVVNYNDSGKTSTVEYAVEYDVVSVTPNTVVRDSFVTHWTLNYRNVDDINIYAGSGNDIFTVGADVVESVHCYGNSGNDAFTFGDGILAPQSGPVFNGGAGIDTLVFDDHLDGSGQVWDVYSNQVVFAQAVVFATAGFEDVQILAGAGGDTIRFSNQTFTQSYTVDGGGNFDDVFVNGARISSLTARGGAGGDHLYLDDRNFPGNLSGGEVFADRVTRSIDVGQGFLDFDVHYSQFSTVEWFLPLAQNSVYVSGVSADIDPLSAFFINGNDSDEFVTVYPRDASGNLTLAGNVFFTAGGGTDAIDELWIVDPDLSPTSGAAYRVHNGLSASSATIDIGSRSVSANSATKAVRLYGTAGPDTFNIEHFSSGSALYIYGRDGDDSCTIGNGNMSANLTSSAAFAFDGGDDDDQFTIANNLTDSTWAYNVQTGSLISGISGIYSWTSQLSNIERQTMIGGSADDFFNIFAVADGVLTECFGEGGYDGLGIGFSLLDITLDAIRGPVVFNAGAGGGRAYVDDADDTTGDVVHLTDSSLGGFVGDTFFGPSGSLSFSNLTNSGTLTGFTLNTGLGADVIFAQPLATTRVEINAGNPTSAPGDALNLALTTALNPVVSGGSAGSVTSSNLQPLSWTGIEQSIGLDTVAPQIVASSYDETTGSAVVFQFSENVSLSLLASHLLLTNTTTGQVISPSAMSVSYDPTTHTARFTFPGLPGALLPGGDYSAVLASAVSDAFGNSLGATSPFTFAVAVRALWVGGNGVWNDPANWAGGQVPGVNDAVVINNLNADVTITVPAGLFAAAGLVSYEPIVIAAGASLAIGGDLTMINTSLTNFGRLMLASSNLETSLTLIESTLSNTSSGKLGWGNPGNPLGSLNVHGQGSFINDGLLFVHTGTFTLAVDGTSKGTFEVLANATLQFKNGYIFDGGTTFNGGGLVQLQSPIASAKVTGDITLDGVIVENTGLVDIAGAQFFLDSGAGLNNRPGGSMGLPGFPPSFGGGISGQGYFINDGLLFVHTGSFGVAVSGSSNGGTFQVASGATLRFDGGFSLNNGTNLTGSGLVLVQPLVPPNPTVPSNPVQVNGFVAATNISVGAYGALNVTGSLSVANSLNVLANGTLAGTGAVNGNVSSAGFLLPGSSPGALTINGNFTQTTGGVLRVEIGGSNAGLFDQLRVLGAVALGGSLEVVFVNGFVSTAGNRFVIIDNDRSDAVAGAFAGLPEGFVLTANNRKLHVSYSGGTGNDVLLTDVTSPALIPDSCQPGKLALLILGTPSNDDIDIKPVGKSSSVEVIMNGVSKGTFSPTGRIIVKAGAGDDVVKVADSVSRSNWLYGEEGNDSLKGGAGPDVLMGGSGNDSLIGGNGNDVMIGGLGADKLVGGGADDLLISGTTLFDAYEIAICGIAAEWSSPRSFASRVANLSGTGTGSSFANRLNGNYFLKFEGSSRTVFDDGAVDSLAGSSGLDWFVLNLDGANVDVATDWTTTEKKDDTD